MRTLISDREPHGNAVWHDLVGQFHRYSGNSVPHRGSQLYLWILGLRAPVSFAKPGIGICMLVSSFLPRERFGSFFSLFSFFFRRFGSRS